MNQVLLLILVSIPTILYGQKRNTPLLAYSKDKLEQDLVFLEKALIEAHPAVGTSISATELSSLFKQTSDQIKHPLNEVQFRHLLSQLITHLHCGHTTVYASKDYYRQTNRNRLAFPLATRYVNGYLYIANNDSLHSTYSKGDIITAINGIPT